MRKFVQHFVIPLAKARQWASICEIGASKGESTDQLLKMRHLSSLSVIDPCFDADLPGRYANDARVRIYKGNSLDMLPSVKESFDAILIDGDHNWYTVFNELSLIRERKLLKRGGMMFFHDVDWPYGRRDMYYQPDAVPTEFRQPYEQQGIQRGVRELQEKSSYNSRFFNAKIEGGEKNGVLTAIEDFHHEHPSEYKFCRVQVGEGLGILLYRQESPSEEARFAAIRIKAAIYSVYGFIDKIFSR